MDKESTTTFVTIRMTKAQRKALTEKAKEAGLTLSAFLHMAALER